MTLKKKTSDNIVGKQKMLVTSIFSFPTMFSEVLKQISDFQMHLLSANVFNLNQSKNWLLGKELTLSQTSPCFHLATVQVFLKTLWEKE